MEIKFTQMPVNITRHYPKLAQAQIAKVEVFNPAGSEPEWYRITFKNNTVREWHYRPARALSSPTCRHWMMSTPPPPPSPAPTKQPHTYCICVTKPYPLCPVHGSSQST